MFRATLALRRRAAGMAREPQSPLIVVLGSTGTGKSQLAVEIAKRYNGEIINGDAMQLYEGLPIITNKISIDEQEGIPHHLLGVARLQDNPWTVGVFKNKAQHLIHEIQAKGRLPILVGGTHYYTQSLLFDDSLVEPSGGIIDDNTHQLSRTELNMKYPILNGSTDEILRELRLVDPVMADRWHPNDRQKLQRSLQIYLTTGRKASDMYKEQREKKLARQDAPEFEGEEPSLLQSTLFFWVHAEAEGLKSRLDKRVDSMVDAGLIEEIKTLWQFSREQGQVIDSTSGIWVSIGYKEFEPYLDALADSESSPSNLDAALIRAIECTKIATRQYSKRQVRWLRIKLLAALTREHALRQLYVLDGSNIESWKADVSNIAVDIVGRFLSGEELPGPSSISPVAAELLSSERKHDLSDRPDLWIRKVCELCNTTAVTQEQWDSHIQSRSHRSTMKKKQKQTNQSLKNTNGNALLPMVNP